MAQRSRGLAKTVGEVVGENLARVRGERGQTQREAVAFLRDRGLTISPGGLAQLESGQRASVGLEFLLVLSKAYDLELADWFAGEGSVELNPEIRIWRADLADALRAQHFELLYGSEARRRLHVQDEPERAAALQLGTTVEVVRDAAQVLWGQSVQQERDARIGDTEGMSARSLQARRGHVTRQLITELRDEREASFRAGIELVKRHPEEYAEHLAEVQRRQEGQ